MIGFPLHPRYFRGNSLLSIQSRRYGAYTWRALFTFLGLFVLAACALFRFFAWLELYRWVHMLPEGLRQQEAERLFVNAADLGGWEELACLAQVLALLFILAITATRCISGLSRFRGKSFRPVSEDTIMLPLRPEQIFFAIIDWPVLRALGWYFLAALVCCLPSRESSDMPILTSPSLLAWFLYGNVRPDPIAFVFAHPRLFFLSRVILTCLFLFATHRLLYIRKFRRGLLGRNPAFWIWVLVAGYWAGLTLFRYLAHGVLPVGPRGVIIAVLALAVAFLVVPFFYMPAEWATGEPDRPLEPFKS